MTVEREHIQRALVRAHGNKKAAARMLGLSRRALYRRLERLDLGDTIMRRQRSVARSRRQPLRLRDASRPRASNRRAEASFVITAASRCPPSSAHAAHI